MSVIDKLCQLSTFIETNNNYSVGTSHHFVVINVKNEGTVIKKTI